MEQLVDADRGRTVALWPSGWDRPIREGTIIAWDHNWVVVQWHDSGKHEATRRWDLRFAD